MTMSDKYTLLAVAQVILVENQWNCARYFDTL
jgi:hypothetical protein